MGPAELLDYDRARLRGLVIEDGSGQSHVAIVAKALGHRRHRQAPRRRSSASSTGDAAIVDAETGEVHLRPPAEVIAAYSDKVRFRARRQQQYRGAARRAGGDQGRRAIDLHINAGLLVDMPHLASPAPTASGCSAPSCSSWCRDSFPRLERQTQIYRQILDEAGDKPVVFRTLDIGGDKVLPYLRQPKEENPALGWRAIRMSLDRPALLRTQVRALLRAAGGRELRVMIPMVSTVGRDRCRPRADRRARKRCCASAAAGHRRRKCASAP